MCNTLDIYPVPCLIISLMEHDNIVWIKEELPSDGGIASQLSTTVTTFDSSLPQGNKEEDGNSISNEEFDISEYEKRLYGNAKQAMDLIGDLCSRSEQITMQQKETLLRLEEEQQEWRRVAEKIEEVTKQNKQLIIAKQKLEQRLTEYNEENGMSQSSDAEENQSRQSTDKIVVTDQDNGLLLFSTQFGLIKKVSSSEWKWPQSAIYTLDNKILVSAMVKDKSGNKTVWKRNLMRFDEKLEFISRIEGPKWIENETVTREHLCMALNGYIYLCVTGETFSALYELTTDGQWTELCHKRST
ncbi:unnamed protein product, partial [Wuchereria bancrofti]